MKNFREISGLDVNPYIGFIAALGTRAATLYLLFGIFVLGVWVVNRFGRIFIYRFPRTGNDHLSFIAAIFTRACLFKFFDFWMHVILLF
jgi:hypothetical protein